MDHRLMWGAGSLPHPLSHYSDRHGSMLHQIQQIMYDRVMRVPIYELAFLWGVGSHVDEAVRRPHQGVFVRGAGPSRSTSNPGNLQ